LPEEVIDKSKIILEKLEKKETNALIPKLAQMDLFSTGDPITVD